MCIRLLLLAVFVPGAYLTLYAQPDAPTGLYVVSQNEANELHWTASAGATGYNIYRSQDSITFTSLASVGAGTTTYTDNALNNGEFYFYGVKATDGTESAFSNIDGSTPEDGFSSFISFDGAGDYAVVDDNQRINFPNYGGEFTVECWVRFNVVSGTQVILVRDDNSSGGAQFYRFALIGGNRFLARVNTGQTDLQSSPALLTIEPHKWYHLALTLDPGPTAAYTDNIIYFFVNGNKVDEKIGVPPNPPDPGVTTATGPVEHGGTFSRLVFGAETSTRPAPYTYKNFLNGDISEVRIWTRYVPQTEIQTNMFTRMRGDETDLFNVWHFDRIYDNEWIYNYAPTNENARKINDVKVVEPHVTAVDDAVSVHVSQTDFPIDVQDNDETYVTYNIPTEIVTPSTNGTATIEPVEGKNILYTPNTGYTGPDQVVYRIYDNTFFSDPLRFAETATVSINVYNNPPVIDSDGGGDNAGITIDENTPAVTTVTATDADAPAISTTLTYSIAGGDDSGLFSIDGSTGVLIFDPDAPDFEAPGDTGTDNVYEVIVRVSDGYLTDEQTISVTINNLNDNDPVIAGGDNIAVSIDENTTAVTTVAATDADMLAALEYSIVGGDDNALFTINTNTGVLAFATAPDFENPADAGGDNIYEVIVRAFDGARLDEQAITVTVNNVNDNDPEITSNAGGDTADLNVDENETAAVTTVVATDADNLATLVYSIEGGDDGTLFDIDPGTGVLAFVTAPDYEIPADLDGDNIYEVIVRASDGARFDEQAITVTVNNVNDNDPEITSNAGGDNATINFNENGTTVTTVTAQDKDDLLALEYSIVGGDDNALFSIDISTGALAFITAPDFETPADVGGDNTYVVIVRAFDGAYFDEQTITITLIDTNDSAPEITSEGGADNVTLYVDENTTAVTTVTATDDDTGTSMSYSISGGDDAGRFSIGSSNGELVFAPAPDFENPTDTDTDNVYIVTVRASDGTWHDEQTITVIVNDVNDNTPIIISNGGGPAAALAVNEMATGVTTVEATDADAGTTLVYSISGGTDATVFSIDPGNGDLTFNTPPDFEDPNDTDMDNVYEVIVQASDGLLTDEQTITITISDMNDDAPFITSNGGGATATIKINENTTAVTTVTATDSDAGTVMVYSLAGGNDNTLFTINSSTGVLTFNSAPDFEAPYDSDMDNFYEVTVQASDGTFNTPQAITVEIINVNEAPANIALSNNNIAENEATGTTIGSLTTTDPDAGDSHTYSIAGGVDAASFIIEGTELKTNEVFNFDEKTTYSLIIRTTDAGGLTFDKSFSIAVTDANDAPTDIALSNNRVLEDEPVGTFIGNLSTIDADAGDTHTYTITGGVDAGLFAIDGSRLLTNASFDLDEQSSYTITIRSTDEAGAFFEKDFEILIEYNPNQDLVIPTAFTPDGNDVNDAWLIRNIELYPRCRIIVFDRSGKEVYQSSGYEKPWDGTFGGRKLPMGTYYYIIELKDRQDRNYKGFVMIL